MSELLRALGALCEPVAPEHRRIAAALELPDGPDATDHTDLFLFQLYPYASVYLDGQGMLGGEARGRIAGFWAALGLLPPAEPDHLAALLGLYAGLGDREAAEPDAAHRRLLRHARRTLLHEHLLSWIPFYLTKVSDIAPRFYQEWGRLLARALAEEAIHLGEPDALPVHLRLAPPLDHPADAGGHTFIAQLLAPARTGMIIVRDDLITAARELGLGGRIAERRFVLRALLAQDTPATLAWLSARAEAVRPPATPILAIDEFWCERAHAAAALLAQLATTATHQEVTNAR